MKLLIMQSSPASRYFLLLRSKYSPQHPVHRLSRHMLTTKPWNRWIRKKVAT